MVTAIPDNYPALVKRAATEFADIEAIKDGDLSLTYAELSEQIDQCAAALVASGIKPGDRVAVWAPNTWEWVVAGLSVLNAGAVMVPINTRFKGREAAYVLRKAEVKLLFTVVGFLGNDYVADLRKSGEEIESLQEIVVLRGEHTEGTVPFQAFLERSDENYLNQVQTESKQVTGDDLGLIMFTSGTTGLPKGVLVQQGPILRGFQHYARELSIRTGDRMLIINPFFHAFGFNGAITPCLDAWCHHVAKPRFRRSRRIATYTRRSNYSSPRTTRYLSKFDKFWKTRRIRYNEFAFSSNRSS